MRFNSIEYELIHSAICHDFLVSTGVICQIRQGREETTMAELRPAGQTKEQEGSTQAVRAGTGILGGVQGRCPVV